MGIKGKILVAAGIIVFIALLFLIGLGERGGVDLYRLRLERDQLKRANAVLQKKNQEQLETIERLEKDLKFVEDVARKELGMIGEDEVVILKKKE